GLNVRLAGAMTSFAADCGFEHAMPVGALTFGLRPAEVTVHAERAGRSLEARLACLLVTRRHRPGRFRREVGERRFDEEAVGLGQVGSPEAPGADGIFQRELAENNLRFGGLQQQLALPELAALALDLVAAAR